MCDIRYWCLDSAKRERGAGPQFEEHLPWLEREAEDEREAEENLAVGAANRIYHAGNRFVEDTLQAVASSNYMRLARLLTRNLQTPCSCRSGISRHLADF